MTNVTIIRSEEQSDAYKYGFALGEQIGTREFRSRAKAILGAPEAEGRFEMATHLVCETELTADEARALLGRTPNAASPTMRPGEAFYASIAARGPTEAQQQRDRSRQFIEESRRRFGLCNDASSALGGEAQALPLVATQRNGAQSDPGRFLRESEQIFGAAKATE